MAISRAHWALESTLSLGCVELLLPKLIHTATGLVATGKGKLATVFSDGTPALAAELGLDQPHRERCREIAARATALRSRALVSGVSCELSNPGACAPYAEDIALLEQLIRSAVRRALTDEAFRASFDAGTAARARRPLKPAA